MSSEKKMQALKTMKWLEENYFSCSDVCLSREIVYEHYLDFCVKSNVVPTGKATLGKLIRSKFPDVTSKRLGARGRSKYHYHGISMKQNDTNYKISKIKGWTRFSGSISNNEKTKQRKEFDKLAPIFSLSSKRGILMPRFPDVSELNIPEGSDENLLQVFLTMYRIHCQCIVDTAVTGNLEQIEVFLLHFWRGLPDHLLPILNSGFLEDIIAICDWILYKTLLCILIPTAIQKLPDTLLNPIHTLEWYWIKWLKNCLENYSITLTEKKLKVGKLFTKSLRRHVSVLHTAQVLGTSLCDETVPTLLTDDLYKISDWIVNLICYATHGADERNMLWCMNVIYDLQIHLQNNPSAENFIGMLESTFDKEINEKISQNNFDLHATVRNLFLKYNYLFSRLCKWLTLEHSENFAVFHLLLTFLHEYQLLILETLHEQTMEEEMFSQIQQYVKPKNTLSGYIHTAHTLSDNDAVEAFNEEQIAAEGQATCQALKQKPPFFEPKTRDNSNDVTNSKLVTSKHLLHIKAMNDKLNHLDTMSIIRDNDGPKESAFGCYDDVETLTNEKKFCENSRKRSMFANESEQCSVIEEWPSCAYQSIRHTSIGSNDTPDYVKTAKDCNFDEWFFAQEKVPDETANYHPSEDMLETNLSIGGAQDFLVAATLHHKQDQNYISQHYPESYFSENNLAFDIALNNCAAALGLSTIPLSANS